MNERMNTSFEVDLGELLLVNDTSSSSSSSMGMNHGPTIKNKKKKAKTTPPVAAKKQKTFAKRDEDLKDRPKKALSAYNCFFASERNKLLRERPIRPIGKPRRSHGKVGFTEMAKIIGAKWKNLNPEDKLHYEVMAANDKWRYNTEMVEWTKNRLEKKSQVVATAAAAQAAAVRPAAQGMTSFQPNFNGFYSATTTSTALSAFFDDTPVSLEPMMIPSTTTVNMPAMLHREGRNAFEAEARDYLLRLQQASFSTPAAPTAVAIAGAGAVADSTNLSKNAQLMANTTTIGNMYNLSSCCNNNDNNNIFEPIPFADAQSSCQHAITTVPHHNGVTTVSSFDVHPHQSLNMDEDCVDLLVELFSPFQNHTAKARVHRRRCPQQQPYHHIQHQSSHYDPTYHQ